MKEIMMSSQSPVVGWSTIKTCAALVAIAVFSYLFAYEVVRFYDFIILIRS